MGSSTGTWILLGLVACIASLASAANIQRSDGQSIYQNNGHTFLTSGAGQIIRGPNGKTVLIGSDGSQIVANDSDEDDSLDLDDGSHNYNSNNIIINGERSTILQNDGNSILYGSANEGSQMSLNGRTVRVINGGLELNENGQVYTFRPKARSENQKETVNINGKPAQVDYSNGDIVIELADHTVVAKVGDRTFLGDRNSFDNRDKIEAESQKEARRIQEVIHANIKKSMDELHAHLQSTLGNMFH
ncbi:hypothetical protein KR059_009546 [Drosophila kikkawai]|nr:hypothetical protein KR059_009546 [Drosophila kikkawai]